MKCHDRTVLQLRLPDVVEVYDDSFSPSASFDCLVRCGAVFCGWVLEEDELRLVRVQLDAKVGDPAVAGFVKEPICRACRLLYITS